LIIKCQRHTPKDELFSAQIERLVQNSRLAALGVYLAGAFATALIFWSLLNGVAEEKNWSPTL